MTEEQIIKLREVLRKVPLELLQKEIKRRQDEYRLRNSKMCKPCLEYGKRIPGCKECYEIHKTYCRNRARIKRGIPIDAPLQTRAKKILAD